MIRGLACVAALALLAGCGDDTPDPATARAAPTPAPLSYDYLTKLPLDVSDIVVADGWAPPPDSGEHVESEATPRPAEALARMAHDRLVASGGAGQATVTITDASLVRVPGQLVASFAVQLALDAGAGDAVPVVAPVVAAVSGTRTLSSDDSEQATADALVRQLMDRMNVELEYQIRQQLKAHLGGAASPAASPVQTEDLPPPGTTPAAPPAPAPPSPSP